MKNKRPMLLLEAIRNIWNKKIPFLSIVTIMAIGMAGLTLIFDLSATLGKNADHFLKGHNAKDFEILGSMGITEEDIEEIKALDGVKDVEGLYRVSGEARFNDECETVTVLSPTQRIGKASVAEGRLPENDGECALNEVTMKKLGVSVGDTVFVELKSRPELVEKEEFLVTGSILHPDYLSKDSYIVMLSEASFRPEEVSNVYFVAYVEADVPDGFQVFSKSYSKRLNEVRATLEEYVNNHSDVRTKEVKEQAEEKYEEAETEVKEGLEDAKAQLEDGKEQLYEGLEEAKKKLDEAEQKIADGETQLKEELDKARKELEKAEKELNQKLADAKKQIEDGEAYANSEISSGRSRLDNAESQYRSGKAEYEKGKSELEDAKKQLEDGKQQIRDEIGDKYPKISGYAELVEDLINETGEAMDDLENIYPELKDDDAWKDLRGILADKDNIKETLQNGTEEEQIECLKDLIDRIDSLYNNLPSGAEMRDRIKEEFTKAFEDAKKKLKDPQTYYDLIDFVKALRELNEARKKIEEGEAELAEAEKKLSDARREIDSGWATFNSKKAEAESQIAEAKAQYEREEANARKQLDDAWKKYYRLKAEKEGELKSAKEEVANGREEYENTKTEKEKELEDGWEQYYEKKDEAEERLKDAKEEIESLERCNYVVNPRTLTLSVTELSSMLNALSSFGFCFVPLFGLVASLVCFSTIILIIEEQKAQIGAAKSLGFRKKESMFKYTLFATVGTLFGNVLGIPAGIFLTKIIVTKLNGFYFIGKMSVYPAVLPTVLLFAGFIGLSGLISILACNGLLNCSAIGLINGSEPKKKTMKGFSNKKHGSLYSRLIRNNMLMDSKRVLVMIVVLVGSTVLIGFGFTINYAFHEACNLHVNDVMRFDMMAVFDDSDMDDYEAVKKFVETNNGSFAEIRYEESLIRLEEGNWVYMMIAGDPDEIKNFIKITDKKGRSLEVPDEGVMIPYRLTEIIGEKVDYEIYDTKLDLRNAHTSANYLAYQWLTALSTKETYEKIYETEYKPNSLIIRMENMDAETLRENVLGINGKIRIISPADQQKRLGSLGMILDSITIVCIALSMMMSFMILVNFTSILVNHRMKEMLVMRINGFSLKEAIGYVARESVATTIIGLIIGVLFGIAFSYLSVRIMEGPQSMFYRLPYLNAWLISTGFNVFFTVVIDLLSFGKIGKVGLTDIGKY